MSEKKLLVDCGNGQYHSVGFKLKALLVLGAAPSENDRSANGHIKYLVSRIVRVWKLAVQTVFDDDSRTSHLL